MVGASTPGIAAPGTRISSFLERSTMAAIVARLRLFISASRPEPVAEGAGAEQQREGRDGGDRRQGGEGVAGVDPFHDRLADPLDDEAERVVGGDRPRRLDHQLLWEEGGREEEDDEDEGEEALDDARLAGAQSDRRADAADRHRADRRQQDRDEGARHAALDRGAEDQADREEPEGGEEAERGGADEPPEHDREAGDRRREEAVGEAHLDVHRERDAAAVAGQHQRLHHRPGEHELEEAVDRREARQFDGAAGAAGLDRQQQRGEDDDRGDQLRPAEGLPDRAHAERADHSQVRAQAAQALTASAWSPAPSPSWARWYPVLATKTSSSVGLTSSSEPTPIPASSSARTTRGMSAAPFSTSTSTVLPSTGGSSGPILAQTSSAAAADPSSSWSRMWGLPTSALSESGVPSATILPLSMMPTLSASWSASSRYWVVRKTVVPSSFSARTSSQIVRRLTGSRPVVGSSRKSTRGSWTSAAARSRRRFIPPE